MEHTAIEAAPAALLSEPPVGWFDQDETCRRLKRSPRRLNELIASGKGPDKVLVQRPGVRPAPYYKPDDVERLERALLPQPRVFSADSEVGPRPAGAIASAAGSELLDLVQRLGVRLAEAVERRPPLDRGPFLTIAAAAKEFGIPARTLQSLARLRLLENDADVFRTSRGGLRVRRLLVASIDANELHVADNIRAAVLTAAKSGADSVERWMPARAGAGGVS
jgi:hypothetical protein